MSTIIKAMKEVLQDTWPMIVLSCIVLIIIRIAYLYKNKQKFIVSKEIMTLVFVMYILCMFQIVTSEDVSSVHGVNVTLFRELTRYQIGTNLFYRNIIGNIIMFIPFGFFTSYYLRLSKKSFIFFLTLIVSITIECIQLRIGRAFDVDDIILNMVGALIGYYIYRIVDNIVGDLSPMAKAILSIIAVLLSVMVMVIIVV